ncbi:hypothetical protein SmJEL517_g02371 [Synchytrium microbalum]|uniref:PNPLA domain-containing protein n=1 Tax=Synchytrium microbalum TaxID=1806994 RepID=A0A507CBY8_9FUNG|nr:uncharacterized protein SmJEL517_g02371 [Synchytrium microbalum]TPX35063.1 hypothetical protein SmJEL517_g02371 [Synchytrium microbalum]
MAVKNVEVEVPKTPIEEDIKAPGWFQQLSDVADYWKNELVALLLHQRKPSYAQTLMDKATTFDQWTAAAEMLDKIEGTIINLSHSWSWGADVIQLGHDKWKANPVSSDYDYRLVQDRLAQLKKIRESGDLMSMIYYLRTSITRNLGDCGNYKLFGVAHLGTKNLIDEYQEEVMTMLKTICDMEAPDQVDESFKYDCFMNMQKAFGRTALLLSGGGTFGLAHLGVLKALHEAKLLPKIVSGSSVGSLIAGILCVRTDEEIGQLFCRETYNLNTFERPGEGNLYLRLTRFLRHGVIYDGEVFRESVKENLKGVGNNNTRGDMTFLEAFNRTKRILNITVSSSTVYEMPRLLNYLTAPNVLIYSAICCSCAIPFVYRSAPLLMKDRSGKVTAWNPSGQVWIDGSVENDLPMARISELFGVNHFIVSQVNPHVVPFMQTSFSPSLISRLVGSTSSVLRSELQHRLGQLSDVGLSSSLTYRAQAILVQKYYGDVTIVPTMTISDYGRIVTNPTTDLFNRYLISGEQSTWPLIPLMRNHIQIEMCISECMYSLRTKKLAGMKQDEREGWKKIGQRLNGVEKDVIISQPDLSR